MCKCTTVEHFEHDYRPLLLLLLRFQGPRICVCSPACLNHLVNSPAADVLAALEYQCSLLTQYSGKDDSQTAIKQR